MVILPWTLVFTRVKDAEKIMTWRKDRNYRYCVVCTRNSKLKLDICCGLGVTTCKIEAGMILSWESLEEWFVYSVWHSLLVLGRP